MRKRFLHLAAAAPLLLALAMPLTCSTPAAASPHGNIVASVKGTANWYTPDGINRRFTFTASKYEDSYVDGEWTVVAGPGLGSIIIRGPVTCLTLVSDHEARLGGRVGTSLFSATFPVGSEIGWIATDNSNGGSGDPDQTTNLREFVNAPPGSAEAFCTTGEVPGGGTPELYPISEGNTTIYVR